MNTDKKQALSVHLKAIRRMLIVSVASVAVLFVLFFYLLCGPLVDFVLAPVRARGIEVITTSVSEALMMQFKVCLIAAVIAGMPVIIWQVWVFVAPALYPQEKRLFAALFFVALLLFVGIPLPGTGAWTGALIAALLDMPLRKSIPSIFLGVVTAGLIMTFVTGGVVAIFAS